MAAGIGSSRSACASHPLVICLTGATATGKTELAVALTQRFAVDIVSVDSALVYRGMDIGTAKPDAATLALAPHRLIDLLDPAEAYSAARFRQDALAEIAAIHAAGRTPLLVGGAMLYFRALRYGLSRLPQADPAVRAAIGELARTQGWSAVHAELKRVDPVAGERIHPNDPQRIQRALEVFRVSGRTLTSLRREAVAAAPALRFLNLGLVPADRAQLARRIARRFNAMLNAGFVDEVRRLQARADLNTQLPSMRSVGYRQIWGYLEGEYGYEDMAARALAATRQLAKRQLTWLRGDRQMIPIVAQSGALDACIAQIRPHVG